MKDQFWDEHYPELPYTVASEDTRFHNPVLGSTALVEVIEHINLFQKRAKNYEHKPF